VIGSGPNGLVAAIELAHAGLAVEVHEAADTIGGGARSAELTLPGFTHDVCSAVYPFAAASPFFRSLHLEEHGLSSSGRSRRASSARVPPSQPWAELCGL
jgi:phytoene dehydrogenase-like protein